MDGDDLYLLAELRILKRLAEEKSKPEVQEALT